MNYTPPPAEIQVDPLVIEQIEAFADCLWEPCDIIEARAIRGRGEVQSTWMSADRFDEIIAWGGPLNDAGHNIYVGLNPRRDYNVKGDSSIELCRSVFVDLDGGCTPDEAVKRRRAAGLPPFTMLTNTGNGCHGFYRLTQAVDTATFTEAQKRLAKALGGDPVVCNPERIVRLPTFRNWKREPYPFCYVLIAKPECQYPIGSILAACPPLEERTAPPPTGSNRQSGNGLDAIARAAAYIAKVENAAEGGRNGLAYKVAAKLREFGLSKADAWPLLCRWNDGNTPPLDAEELADCWDHADKYARNPAGSKLDEQPQWERNGHHGTSGQAGGAQAEKEKPHTGPLVTCLADVEPRKVAWLWPGRIPLGRITLLVGRPGEGKSFLTTDMASRVSTGSPWPDGTDCPQGSVLLISAEDDPGDTIRPRLDAHYADVNKIHLLSGIRYQDNNGETERVITLADIAAIEETLRRLDDCKLIVVDPVGSYLGGKTDGHRDNEVRGVLAPIAALAERYGAAVLVVAHRRKSAGNSADDLALGSRAFTGIARAVWHLSRDPDNKNRRLFLPGKNNLAREGDGLAFFMIDDPPRIAWAVDPVGMHADDALAAENKKHGPQAAAREDATEWLSAALANGPRPAKEIEDEWVNGQGGSKATLKRAKQKIGVVSYRDQVPGPWTWRASHKETTRGSTTT